MLRDVTVQDFQSQGVAYMKCLEADPMRLLAEITQVAARKYSEDKQRLLGQSTGLRTMPFPTKKRPANHDSSDTTVKKKPKQCPTVSVAKKMCVLATASPAMRANEKRLPSKTGDDHSEQRCDNLVKIQKCDLVPRIRIGQPRNCHNSTPMPNPSSDMPPELRSRIEEMGGSEVVLVIQKKLFHTDVNKTQCRLSVPFTHVVKEFLNEKEKASLEQNVGKKKAGIDMLLIDPRLNEYTVCLKRWDMKKERGKTSSIYAVTSSSWMRIKANNDLREGMLVQLWSFRLNQKPCFALVRL